ncbi:NAD(P)/FAD-dependent oxidoreductase [Paenibacillus harenae]|uniref:NAD(P)/FAD-dependent oxidoreductase n=1 Tax=Paenibacillus harenae TaxID=306543 RepID=UPI00278EC57D|nr:NAD(P)/FAD-dependent oxidoreductase [Paenibacillus harenae]MDQ0063091.1 putative FAD-dependent dehydrogenase [Paenibacillus harenae]
MFDIVIIGAGVSGIFAAHALAEGNKRVLMIDKGKPLNERYCPLDKGGPCGCTSCAKYVGFGGLGKSEGKYNYTNDFGGDLETKVGYSKALQLMDEVDDILCRYGAGQAAMYSTENPLLAKRAGEAGFDVLATRTRHLGSALSEEVLQAMFDDLARGISFLFETEVSLIREHPEGFELSIPERDPIYTKKLIIATGRSGTEWWSGQCRALGISQQIARLDIGLRFEMFGGQLDAILQEQFETKLRFSGEGFTATTYCMNPRGRVIRKYQDGLVMADGQNYREQAEGSPNLNFTLFAPSYFASLEEADTYAREVIGGINQGGDRIVAQRLGDLRKGRGTSEAGGTSNRIKPTLKADWGNLVDELPDSYIRISLSFVDAMERLLGIAVDEDTILYGVDAKFYAPMLDTSKDFESRIANLHVIGDCSGITHSLSQAAASGLHTGKRLAFA